MAAYRRLCVGDRPVVVSFPEWLLHDDRVALVYRRLCRESGGRCLSYTDGSQVVLIVPTNALDDDEALCWALHKLQDEITVWRLATADAVRTPTGRANIAGRRSPSAHVTRANRAAGTVPREAGWRIA